MTLPSQINILHINDWPIAVKITVLCTVIAIVLACALTAIGYFQAAAGLAQQADKEIEADAHIVETTIDDWHRQRLATLALAAVTPASDARRRGQVPRRAPAISAEALAILRSIAQRNQDIETVGIMDSDGTYVWTSIQRRVGVSGPQYDFFQEALQGREFISGVRISGITNNRRCTTRSRSGMPPTASSACSARGARSLP